MGFTVPNTGSSVRGYAFSMNTFATAMPMVPLVRYEDRYSRAIGKWMLNAANAARLFYADEHTPENQSSEFWLGDPNNVIAYEGLRHHWFESFDSEELFAGGDPLVSEWGPINTDFSIYGSAVTGVFGSIIKTTNVEKILQLDLLATDFYHDAAYPTYLYYNPLGTSESVQIDLGSGQFDLYDAVSNSFLFRNLTGQVAFTIASDKAVQLVLAPAGGVATTEGSKLLVDGVVIDYNVPYADFDGNGIVDGLDLQIWEGAYGLTVAGDADGDGDSDGQDFLVWQRQLQAAAPIAAAVPEPKSLVAALLALTAVLSAGRILRQLISPALIVKNDLGVSRAPIRGISVACEMVSQTAPFPGRQTILHNRMLFKA